MSKKQEMVSEMFSTKTLNLFGRIVAVVFAVVVINMILMQSICSNCGILTMIIFVFFGLPALAAGLFVFVLIKRTKYEKFINSKNVNIFCVILGVILAAIVIPQSINDYYDIVPPKEVTNYWLVDEGQDIKNHITGMDINYDTTYAAKNGYFTIKTNNIYQSNILEGTNFIWSYDEVTKTITFTEQYTMFSKKTDGWTLTLRLDINKSEEPHYTMTTHYVSNTNFTFFNTTFLDGATWTGANDYND